MLLHLLVPAIALDASLLSSSCVHARHGSLICYALCKWMLRRGRPCRCSDDTAPAVARHVGAAEDSSRECQVEWMHKAESVSLPNPGLARTLGPAVHNRTAPHLYRISNLQFPTPNGRPCPEPAYPPPSIVDPCNVIRWPFSTEFRAMTSCTLAGSSCETSAICSQHALSPLLDSDRW